MRKYLLAGLAAASLAAPARAQSGPETIRSFFDTWLLKDLAYFQARFGVPEETRRDYWDQFGGRRTMSYTIGRCSYQVIAERGRVIAIGLRVEGQCDVRVNRSILGVDRASAIRPRDLADRERWRFLRDCSVTGPVCARLDDDGAVIGEPLSTYYRSAVSAEMMPEISIEGDWRDRNGDLDPASSGTPWLYRESYGLYRGE